MKKKRAPATKHRIIVSDVNPGDGNKQESIKKSDSTDSPENSFPIVGIGASAGGLAAFETFFSGLPDGPGCGMAFVIVQHLAPDHHSILTELIGRYTSMKVSEVKDGMAVKPDCIYVIPPNHNMALLNGNLQLLDPVTVRGQRLTIDYFFRSLAEDQNQKAICIILSGTGSDGSQGVRDIKEKGGLVMVQDPKTTEFDGMPRSAIATGLVDYIIPPSEMITRLMDYVAKSLRKTLLQTLPSDPKTENALHKIFILLRGQTGHDFSQYKLTTILRRIDRRMYVHQIEKMEEYVKFIQQTPAEIEILFRELLIGVTNFFRDPPAFRALEGKCIPQLFSGKLPDSAIRVWCPGCSTGEEAYSIAILLQEHKEFLKQNWQIQVFATDIDSHAIKTARAGLYPLSIASDISAERLARFFVPEKQYNGYRIHKVIRDMLIFSEQDVIKDPPFSKLDLVSCRNLLIYLNQELQKKLIPMFHYALNPGGFLFLGTSETVGEFSNHFSTINRKLKLYQSREILYTEENRPVGSLVASIPHKEYSPRVVEKTTVLRGQPLRELTEQTLLQMLISAGVLVNARGDILYFHGRTGRYLEPASGEAGVNNVLKMAREGLRIYLTRALRKATKNLEIVHYPGLRVKTNGDFTVVNLTIKPVMQIPADILETALYLIILEEPPIAENQQIQDGSKSDNIPGHGSATADEEDARFIELRQELLTKEENLNAANEELEIINRELENVIQELKSSNEEMQSVNEELQSTNEEMETAKEELQSINEELATVNSELQTKVMDLSIANNDLNNLLAGTGIATIFLDLKLHIMRFTPASKLIFNLIMSDIGRPMADLVSNLTDYIEIETDARNVLDKLVIKEMEVQTRKGDWYMMRIQPYRTTENVIEGVAITFVDITELKKIRDELQKARSLSYLASIVRDSNDAITVQDMEGQILNWNPKAEKTFGWNKVEALTMNIRDMIPEKKREETLAKVHQIAQAKVPEPYRTQWLTKDGRIVEVWMTTTVLVNEAGKMYGITSMVREINTNTND